MVAFDTTLFPLVEMQAVSNVHNEWVALTLDVAGASSVGAVTDALHSLFNAPDLLAATAPLDCILLLDSPAVLTPALLNLMPANRVGFAIAASALGDDAQRKQTLALREAGYRVLLDGPLPEGMATPPTLRAATLDCSEGLPLHLNAKTALLAMFGPHLARHVDSGARLAQCAAGGFEWFSGNWAQHPLPATEPNDGTSRKRLLTLLGLLARDADSRELETLLKQDPALSYQLLKLVNSAAFALSTPITSFGQAISLLGRRQLQRWLQLLLYARQQPDGRVNPLLPLAALRAAQLECLCKLQGGDRDAQDLAFMTGVFSLLHVLFAIPMGEIVGALSLAPAAADALLARTGRLGELLRLVELGAADVAELSKVGLEPLPWWQSQLHAYHWAIQVSRNL